MPNHEDKSGVLAACELPAWARAAGPWADIIISTRVSLSRNLAGTHFPNRADAALRQRTLDAVLAAADNAGERLGLPLRPYILSDLSDVERQALWEAYQVDIDQTPTPEHSALILSDDRRVSVLVNAEDHVRVMCLLSGLSALRAYSTATSVAEAVGRFVRYARHPRYGYLTAQPALVGTGMCVSVVVHLVGLHMLGRLQDVLRSAGEMQAATGSVLPIRGQSQEWLVQLSTSRTVGVDAREVATSVEETTKQLVTFEQESRDALMRDRREEVVDSIWRAFATLRHARLLSSAETMTHISTLRLGVGLGIVRGLDARALNRLSLLIAPGLLQARVGRALPEDERRAIRAKVVRAALRSKGS
jgi:protein arginine kinase